MHLRSAVLLALWVLLLVCPYGAGAELVVAFGAEGDPGSDGVSGDPPGMGGPGGPGETVSATADAPGESNEAGAVGGDGGVGGQGGDALGGTLEAGAGGVGGAGGDATAVALTLGANQVRAVAGGGDAGSLGANGAGEAPLPMPVPGNAGGDAVASASLDYAGSEAVCVETEAFGGLGGDAFGAAPAGDGGHATATAAAIATGESGPESLHVLASAEGGGTQSGVPGAAQSVATGSASGDGDVSVEALAVGGFERSFIGVAVPMGGATATAFGESLGAGSVYVLAEAKATSSGLLSSVGDVSASAEGHSQSGDVLVDAVVKVGPVAGGGVTTELHDAASGSTAGHLKLNQVLESSAGDMKSSLTATNPGGGNLELELSVFALEPRVEGESADVFLGDVIGTSDTGADVTIDVMARAGAVVGGDTASNVFREKQDGGGVSVPSVIHGESNGGAVRVAALLEAGSARFMEGGAQPNQGGSIELLDAVTGETTGDLWLQQSASAGAGEDGRDLFGPPREGGDGGSARSELSHHGSSESITLVSRARGGEAGRGDVFGGGFALGGSASSAVDVYNDAGSVEVIAGAGGGGGEGVGGDAVVEVLARTSGDGHAVRIQNLLPDPNSTRFPLVAGAFGGSAGSLSLVFAPQALDLPDGGIGTSSSIGIAEGDSLVEVHDRASGGRGGSIDVLMGAPAAGSSGDGGTAFSNAQAQGGGVSAVMAKASAFGGGGGGGDSEQAGDGGDATADASAIGLGQVEAVATARAGAGGVGPISGIGGTANATASANGASGFASATASSGGLFTSPPSGATGSGAFLGATANAAVASQVDVVASSTVGGGVGALLVPTPFEARAFVVADPFPSAVDPVAGNAALAEILADEPGADVLAIASWDATASDDAATSERSIVLDITLNRDDENRDLLLAAFDISATGDGFESLTFRLEKAGQAFGQEQVFDDVAALRAFFEDNLIDVGQAVFGLGTSFAVSASFDVTLGEGDAFGMRFAYATVPEPSTGLLLGCALVVIGLRRRRAR